MRADARRAASSLHAEPTRDMALPPRIARRQELVADRAATGAANAASI